MTSRPGSSHSRGSSTHSRESLLESDHDEELHDDLLERAVSASASRSRRNQRSSSASLHDLELMQARGGRNERNPSDSLLPAFDAANATDDQDRASQPPDLARRTTSTSIGGTHTSSAHLRFVLEEDDGSAADCPAPAAAPAAAAAPGGMDASGVSRDGSVASAYSEYSEYEEDEFDPEWHARQNQQATLALLAKSGPRQSFNSNQATDGTTEKTRSIVSGSDMDSVSESPSSDSNRVGSQLFANRRDLREEVDQSVNLMDASVGNYDDPREYGELLPGNNRRVPRRARRQQQGDSRTQTFLAAAQNSLVDVFLDNSTGDGSRMPSFRRTLSRNSGGSNNGSFRQQANAAAGGTHQRRLFYGHTPPLPPTIQERRYNWCANLCSLENCCKLVIVLFVMIFIVIMALPQGAWWVQEKLGLINDKGDPMLSAPTLPLPTLPLISEEDVRLAALHKMILTHELTSKTDLLNKGTPQYQASRWLANEDPANLTLVRSDVRSLVEPHKVLNRYAMATFYLAMNGPRRDKETNDVLWNETHWHTNEDWMSQKHICDWYGIECEGQNHIEHFNLTNNHLSGTIPSELRVFSNLILVDLSHNEVRGSFPDFVGDHWLDLEYLILSKNEFQGTLPPSIGKLTHLQELVLTHTNLEGSIPSELNNLTQLRVLKMDHNKFDGSIPPLGDLAPSLENLNFYSNLLTGFVPKSVFQLTNLVELLLDHNYLKGSIAFSQKAAFHKLEVFTISNNKITGLLPDVWNQTRNLVDFQVDNNHIRGTIPSSLALLTDLEYLTLDDNPITGTIPELGHLESLVVLQVHHTELVGSMPDEICSLKVRRGVDLLVFGDCEEGRFNCQCCDRCF